MATETEPASYAQADAVFLQAIVDAGEARLEAQLTASLAADQRALILAGFLVPTIAALVGAAVALLLQQPPHRFLGWLALVGAGGLFVSLVMVVYAARPVGWSFPGIRPKAWLGDIASKKEAGARLAELAADAELRAGENAVLMASNGACVRTALCIAAATLAIGGAAVVWFFVAGV